MKAKKTDWQQKFETVVTVRVKHQDLAAFQKAAEDDHRSDADWVRHVLRREAAPYYPKDDHPPRANLR
jgi:hypothetical protein